LNWRKLHPELFLTGNKFGLSFEVYTHGGRNPTGIDTLHWAKLMETYGAGEILLTSMDCDGTKNGYDLELNRTISESLTIPLIASGGAGTLNHLFEGIAEGKADAVLAASIFHFKEFTIEETKRYLKSKGIPIRIVQGLNIPAFKYIPTRGVCTCFLFSRSAPDRRKGIAEGGEFGEVEGAGALGRFDTERAVAFTNIDELFP
jgi:hypothetical protein